jgi:endonuclease/exonuclease/phosphatase family metal-dependent hydrolase
MAAIHRLSGTFLAMALCSKMCLAGPISIMAYNVQNLFDTKHDNGKRDTAFLPMATKLANSGFLKSCNNLPSPAWRDECKTLDWNDEALRTKMMRLAAVIQGDGNDRAPDILFLEEVENIEVLHTFRGHSLQNAGYQTAVLIEGQDARGIDCAILSKFPLASRPVLHQIPIVKYTNSRKEQLRGILAVQVKVDETHLATLLAVHFPSPQKPWNLRRQAMEFLSQLAIKYQKDGIVIAGGDINNTASEEKRYGLLGRFTAPKWLISHFVGCQECPGTHFHRSSNSWSFLDVIMVFRESLGPWSIIPKSVEVASSVPNQVDRLGHPIGYDPLSGVGASDHLPVRLSITVAKQF